MKKLLISLSVIFVLLFAIASVAYAESDTEETLCGVVTVNLNFRESPTGSGALICTIPSGASVAVISTAYNNGWAKIYYNGQIGYSMLSYISFTSHDYYLSACTSSTGCNVPSSETYTCSRCGFQYTEEIPGREHDLFTVLYSGGTPGLPDLIPFDCELGGYKHSFCQYEDCFYAVTEEVAPGHIYSVVAEISPTYHSEGTRTLQCDRCGYRDYVTLPVLVDDVISEDFFFPGSNLHDRLVEVVRDLRPRFGLHICQFAYWNYYR